MAATYEPLATTTLGSSASSVTFSSISGSYTDLVLIAQPSASGNLNLVMEINSDTGSNYSFTALGGSGSSAGSNRDTNNTSGFIDWYGYMSTGQSNYIININNYSNATTYKTILTRANNTGNGTNANVTLWRSTSAITSIKLKTLSGTISSGSTFTLYGIKAA